MSAQESVRFAFEGPDGRVRITPPLFFGNQLEVSPDDLSLFAPTGSAIYGLCEHRGNPFKEGPNQEAVGGVIFFGNKVVKADILALARVLDIPARRDYVVFVTRAENPGEDGYLTQIRLVSRFGLRFLYGAITAEEYDQFHDQEVTMQEALFAFIEDQKRVWGTTFWQSPKLEGKFGGDGDFAREELSFGLMVENSDYGIYRIWSRAWLVTK